MFLTRKVITGLTNDQEAVHPTTHVVQEEVPVRKLARQITSVEEDIPIEEATGEPYRNVYTSLIQSHLERLEEAGAVKYDTNAKTVVPGQNLLALATVAMTTSSITRLLFSHDVAELQAKKLDQELRD